jgi:PAS domain S-box-containing protein
MNSPLRVLHLEDSRRDAELIQSTFESEALDCQVVHVKNQQQFEAAFLQERFDVILSDYSLPHYNGFSALDFVRARDADVPFILVSGTLGEELAVQGLKSGATDYILKERLNRLVPAVQRALQEAVDRAERRRAEEGLETMRRQYELILHSAGEGIYGLDSNGRATFVNPAAANMLGYTVEELIGRPMHPLIHHTKHDGSAFEAENCPIHGTSECTMCRIDNEVFWRKDGKSFPVEYLGTPIQNEQGELMGAVVMFRDITERRQLEQQVRQAQKMEAIGQLAGGIAHDFNNILGCIVGYAELAMMEVPNHAEVQEHLQEVLNASQRAKELVLQILTFSRQQEKERKPMKLEPVIKEALKLLHASLPSTIKIRAEIQSDAPTVLADATQIHQIIMNLATNAAHAMKAEGQWTVKLRTVDVDAPAARAHPDLRAGRYVVLSAADTGCGMDQATMQRMFEPFFTTKGPGEGTGLGLAVVHGIMKSHEGAIMVSSEPGKGTTFQLYFPALDGVATVSIHHPGPIPCGHGERVLFVDDEFHLASLGKKMLERAGYRVTIHTNASEALAAFRADPSGYDLIISDLTMPTLTGADLAGEILRLRPDLPIILATGCGGSMNSDRAQALGIRELLTKPLTARSLTLSVDRALGRSKGI